MSVPDALDLDAPVGDSDPLGILATAEASLAHFDAARADVERLEIPYPPTAVQNVAVCGMGGSAIAADLVAGAYSERLRVPMATIRDYRLPGWVGEDTLVILSSYSGTTEETLTCALDATDRGALCVALTSGGKLAERYGAEDGVPTLVLPGGLQPRAALLRSLVPLVVVLERMGVIPPMRTSSTRPARRSRARWRPLARRYRRRPTRRSSSRCSCAVTCRSSGAVS